MRFRPVLALFALAVVSPAQAQQFAVWPDILLEANGTGSGYMLNGIGSPSVAYDTDQGRYVMVFETRLTDATADCPAGKWGLGYAESPDGITWTPGTTPLLEPLAGSYYSCVAAHPTVIYDVKNKRLFAFWKAEQALSACDAGPQAWGCERYVGIGQTEIKYFQNGTIKSIRHESLPTLIVGQNFGYPKVIRNPPDSNTGWYLALTKYPSAYIATGVEQQDRVNWTLDPNPWLVPGVVSWALTEYINPALTCETRADYPFKAWVGGRTIGGGVITEAGWGEAISDDSVAWLLNQTPAVAFIGSYEWRHWDVLRTEDAPNSEWLVWFSEKDASGKNRVRFASTVPIWNDTDVYEKQCEN